MQAAAQKFVARGFMPPLTRLAGQQAHAAQLTQSSWTWSSFSALSHGGEPVKPLSLRSLAQPMQVKPLTSSEAGEDSKSKSASTKPAIHVTGTLKDGREVVVRRLEKKDVDSADRWMSESLWMAEDSRHDALIAHVDGQFAALLEIDLQTHELSRPLCENFLRKNGLTQADVCVSSTWVHHTFNDEGLDRALLQAQVKAGAQAGYEAVVHESCSKREQALIASMGGVVQPGCEVPWALLRTDAAANKADVKASSS